jgi:hypothetical protein
VGHNQNHGFGKGHVVIHGELWGQKWFSFKPPLVMPAIMQLHRVIDLGHIEYVAMDRRCTKGQNHSYLVTKEDLFSLKESGLIQRSRGHCLEHSWMLGLILIPMKVVIKNGGGV